MTSPPEASPDAAAGKSGVSADAKPAPEATAGPAVTATPTDTPRADETAVTAADHNQPPAAAADDDNAVNPLDFVGAVDSNHDLPTAETLRKIDKYVVLDRHGKSHTFRSIYTGRHAARRVLVIFVRHFYCGNCQDYLRTLSAAITPASLLRLPVPTSIAVIGCGDPALIDMYAAATGCPFPIYADPARRLYAELGMVRTLALGATRPAYARRSLVAASARSVLQGLRQIPAGLALRGGDMKQVGGEFLFEPVGVAAAGGDGAGAGAGGGGGDAVGVTSPVGGPPPWAEVERSLDEAARAAARARSETSLDGKGEEDEGEDKVVTWCHRMRTTRDHTEVPELMEVLGLEGHGRPSGG
ncbi:hypothetical protein VTK56DRAFT_1043 [Thermocarpiscus australiensis]